MDAATDHLSPELATEVLTPSNIPTEPRRALELALEGLEAVRRRLEKLRMRRLIADAGRRGDADPIRAIVTTRKQVD